MLQGEHSAILLTFIKLPFSIETFVLSIFKWPLKTGFTVIHTKYSQADGNKYKFPVTRWPAGNLCKQF